jgi:5-methyltetrahydropteroyltriglutamate--homocysteine methyltransferase
MKVSALGSYPRIGEGAEKQKLRRAIQQYQAGKISEKDLGKIQENVTVTVLREQEEAGLDWVTDGLIRREDGQTYFTDHLGGFHRRNLLRYFDTNTYYRQPVCDGPVRWTEPITVADYKFASRQTPLPVRPVVTGPFTLAGLTLDEHYRDTGTYIGDLTTAMNQELKALSSAGAPMLQVDEPILTRHAEDAGIVREVFTKLVDGVNTPVWVALYMGPVVPLLEQIDSWPVAGVWLDCVSDPDTVQRLSEKPFAEDKQLGLGIVDARNTKLETVDEIRNQLKRVADKTPLERLAVTTSAGLEFLPRDRAQQKLQRMSEAVQSFQQ